MYVDDPGWLLPTAGSEIIFASLHGMVNFDMGSWIWVRFVSIAVHLGLLVFRLMELGTCLS